MHGKHADVPFVGVSRRRTHRLDEAVSAVAADTVNVLHQVAHSQHFGLIDLDRLRLRRRGPQTTHRHRQNHSSHVPFLRC